MVVAWSFSGEGQDAVSVSAEKRFSQRCISDWELMDLRPTGFKMNQQNTPAMTKMQTKDTSNDKIKASTTRLLPVIATAQSDTCSLGGLSILRIALLLCTLFLPPRHPSSHLRKQKTRWKHGEYDAGDENHADTWSVTVLAKQKRRASQSFESNKRWLVLHNGVSPPTGHFCDSV